MSWGFNGLVLIIQAGTILYMQIGEELGGGYAILAAIFGSVALVSALLPKINWNKKL